MSTDRRIKVQQVTYHRNGPGTGEGFHAVKFSHSVWGQMVAIVFGGDGQVAVLNRYLLAAGNIEGSSSDATRNNAWDGGGDTEDTLRQAVLEFEQGRSSLPPAPRPVLDWEGSDEEGWQLLYPAGGSTWTVLEFSPGKWRINAGGTGNPEGYPDSSTAMLAAEGELRKRLDALAPLFSREGDPLRIACETAKDYAELAGLWEGRARRLGWKYNRAEVEAEMGRAP